MARAGPRLVLSEEAVRAKSGLGPHRDLGAPAGGGASVRVAGGGCRASRGGRAWLPGRRTVGRWGPSAQAPWASGTVSGGRAGRACPGEDPAPRTQVRPLPAFSPGVAAPACLSGHCGTVTGGYIRRGERASLALRERSPPSHWGPLSVVLLGPLYADCWAWPS